MGLPNATSILSNIPAGLRAVVSRVDDGEVATLAVRTALNESGSISLSGLDRMVRTNIWMLTVDFSGGVTVGDTLMVSNVPAIVFDAMTSCGGLITRAAVVLCEDTVSVGDVDLACHLGMLGQDADASLGGFLPEDTQGFFIPEAIIPAGVEIAATDPVVIAGEQLIVHHVSQDHRHGVLCVTCKRRGDA
jgi:hypothetical protein